MDENGKKNYQFKVCILTSGFPRYEGDLFGNFILSLSKELVKQGLKVSVLAPHAPKVKKTEEFHRVKVHRFFYFLPFSLQKLCYGSGIPTNIRHSLLAKLQLPFFFLSQLFSLIWLIKREKINIVNSHWMVAQGLNGALVRKFLGIHHINTVHSAGLFALKRFPFGKFIARFIVRNVDCIIAVSSFIKSNLDELVGYDTKATVCPMGIDTNAFVPKDQSKLREKYDIRAKYILLFVGRLIEVKGVEYLIDALKILTTKLPDLKLFIAGTGNLEESLKNRVSKLNLSSHVSFLGAINHEDLINYYNICDLLILPSIVDRYSQTEGSPMAILEAFSCGKPVVASNVGGLPELVKCGYNGLLAVPKNPKDIADKIIKILKELPIEKLGRNARQTAINYDWDNIGRKYAGIIRRLAI